ncbi:hypothetical protein GS946_10930 [Rhodococcus hoagii]|nr:hypothetical protein [Prescottella equi]
MAVQKREVGGRIRWVGRYRGSDGIERSQTFDTRGAAKDWVNDRERELRRGEWINPKDQEVTVGKMWADWEAAAKKTDGTGRCASSSAATLAGSSVRRSARSQGI